MPSRVSTAGFAVALLVAFASGAAAMHVLEPAEPAPPRTEKPLPFRLAAKPGGWTVSELCAALTTTTGRPILLDAVGHSVKETRIECNADVVLPGPRLFAWVQAALSAKKIALVPVGPACANGERTWQLLEWANENMIKCAVRIDDRDVLEYEDRDGLYVTTTLLVPDGIDTTQMRNALSPLSTQYAGLGRIQDVPDGRSLVVCDFAPVVASMKRAIDAVGAVTQSPRPRRPAVD